MPNCGSVPESKMLSLSSGPKEVSMDERFNNLVQAIAIMLAVCGFVIFVVAPKDNERLQRMAVAFLTGGIGGTVGLYLVHRPRELNLTAAEITAAAIGALVVFIKLIGRS